MSSWLRRALPAAVILSAGIGLWALAAAQPPEEAVQWSAAWEPGAPVAAGGTADITVSASIAEGWHVYALEEPAGGPIPLKVSLKDGSPASLDGTPTGSPPQKVHDPRFGLDTQLYTRSLTVNIPVRLTQGTVVGEVVVKVRYQSCTERECRPPRTVQLAVPVTVDTHD
jgi:thiol:disulfide interchange protein DsbD